MFLLSPLTFFWIFLLLAFLFYKLKKQRAFRFFLWFGLIEFYIFSATPLPVFLANHLETQYPVYDPAKTANVNMPILVLGAGHSNDPKMTHLNQLSEPGLNRLLQGIMLYRQLPGRPLITSGYSYSGGRTNAQVSAEMAVLLGVSPKDTLMMVRPTSTWDEAVEFKKRFGTKPFFLVTSAIHMPRSVEVFKRFGLNPIAVPTNYMIKSLPGESIYSWKPSWANILITEKVLHEYSGAYFYRWFKKPEKEAAPASTNR